MNRCSIGCEKITMSKIKRSKDIFQEVFGEPEVFLHVRGENVYYTNERSPLVIQVKDYVHFGMFIQLKDGGRWSFQFPNQRGYKGDYDHFPSTVRHPKARWRRMLWERYGFPVPRYGRCLSFRNRKQITTFMMKVWNTIAMPHCGLEYLDDPSQGKRAIFGGFTEFQVVSRSTISRLGNPGFPRYIPIKVRSWMADNYPQVHSDDYPQIFYSTGGTTMMRGAFSVGYSHICVNLFLSGRSLEDIVFLDDLFEYLSDTGDERKVQYASKRLGMDLKSKEAWERLYKRYRSFLFAALSPKSNAKRLPPEVIEIHLKPYLFPKKVIKKLEGM